MTQEAMKLALEALEADELDMVDDGSGNMIFRKEQAITAIKEALAEHAMREVQRLGQEIEQEPVADRAFLERTLIAMEGVIDVADRKTDEFDALRACIIELTLMLYTTPPQRIEQEPICPDCKAVVLYECVACSSNNYPPQRKPLTDEVITRIGMTHQGLHQVARAIEAAHGIKENT